MELNNKVLVLPNICGIEIDLTGVATPSQEPSLQSFYNTYVQDSTAVPVYFTPSKATITEASEDTRAGHVYNQTLRLEFPSNDPLRAKRITDYKKVKYIYIKLSSGMIIFFGRNDYYQNAPLKIKSASNEKTTQITYSCKSIVPFGFTNGSFDFLIPDDFPINFFNLN